MIQLEPCYMDSKFGYPVTDSKFGYPAIPAKGTVDGDTPDICDPPVVSEQERLGELDYIADSMQKLFETPCTPDPVQEFFEPVANKADTLKPQYSLIPWDLLEAYLDRTHKETYALDLIWLMDKCHHIINNPGTEDIYIITELMDYVSNGIGLAPACIALQYGVVKYARDNWKQGFGGDYKRLLEATIRHSLAQLQGEDYDGEALPGFPKGNLHMGAIYFSLMVACNEAHIHFNGKPRWTHKG